MRYFDHDTTASSDSLIINLRVQHSGAAVDAYYALIEEMYLNEEPFLFGKNTPPTTALSVRLATDYQTLSEWITTMISTGLLTIEEELQDDTKMLFSERVKANIEAYQEKCEKARQAGKKGGQVSKRKANDKRTLSERQAKKRKEKKGDITSSVISPISSSAVAEAAPQEMESTPCPPHILAQFGTVGKRAV